MRTDRAGLRGRVRQRTGMAAGALVLLLVRTPAAEQTGVTKSAAPTLAEETATPRG
ncbi:hypothetical protein ABZY09_26375 [Streptomyces sp. NPDC002928]|uniref:hypothetical protein n=1 Tax=Streptomyces sp. NPDC002928 TaxID=3154440 RepID=UPI0033A03F68